MPNNPLTDEQLAELDRMYAAATKGMNWHEVAFWHAAIAQRYPALRQRLLDAESRLAEAERERDELEAELEEARANSIEYEKDCTKALCGLAREFDYEWDGDGATADDLREFISETVRHLKKMRDGLAARDAQQRREGAAEWLEADANNADSQLWTREKQLQAAKRLREGK